jgi:hypothetical protein
MSAVQDAVIAELERANAALQRQCDENRNERDASAAMAEVLEVINRSPGDPQPVFETILQKAHTLCGAVLGSVGTFNGVYFQAIATLGYLSPTRRWSASPSVRTAAFSRSSTELDLCMTWISGLQMPTTT